MSYSELFILAVGLCFDTLAVSLSGGVCMKQRNIKPWLKIILIFALFQGGMTGVGFLFGVGVSDYITQYDHWIAFALLAFIGGKMIKESFEKGKESSVNLLNNRVLITVAIATSIDALAVGISLAFINLSYQRIVAGCMIIAIVTATASIIGLTGGRHLGPRFGKRSELLGGLILIVIGAKILIEHLS